MNNRQDEADKDGDFSTRETSRVRGINNLSNEIESDLDLKPYSAAYGKMACKHKIHKYKYIFPKTWFHIHHRTRLTRPSPGKEPVYAL